jgi:hypothetical protein
MIIDELIDERSARTDLSATAALGGSQTPPISSQSQQANTENADGY